MRVLPSRPFIPRKRNEQVVIPRYQLPPAEMLSFIIPTLNETRVITKTLMALQPLRQQGHEVILVDAGSEDDTVDLARPLVDQILESQPGRARQMNVGAAHAWGDTFLFLHADTLLPEDANSLVAQALKKRPWGFFCVKLDSAHPLIKLVALMMNLRSCLSGIGTGDQALFMSREVFEAEGGFAAIPLMEDVELSKRFKRRVSRPAIIRRRLTTSARRWQHQGIFNTIFLMWRLRWAYALGARPEELVKRYYP